LSTSLARHPMSCAGQTALAKTSPARPVQARHLFFHGRWGQYGRGGFLNDLAGDLPPDDARVLYAAQQPFKKSLTTRKTRMRVAHQAVPSSRVHARPAQSLPTWKRFMAKRMGAETRSRAMVAASALIITPHASRISIVDALPSEALSWGDAPRLIVMPLLTMLERLHCF